MAQAIQFAGGRVRASVAEHLAILEMIEAGDGAGAETLIRDHLSRGSEVRARIFADITAAPGSRASAVPAGEPG